MRNLFTRLVALSLLSTLPFSASASSINLDTWQITADEGQDMQLNLSIEYVPTGESATVDIDPTDTETEDVNVEAAAAELGDVQISEFVSDPVTGASEWIELSNDTESSINLTGWYLLEGSGKKTVLDATIPAEGYLLVSEPKGALNNSGDLIQLYDPNDTWMDGVAYGNWQDATAPAASDPESVGRNQNGVFVIMNPTPGAQNQEPTADTDDETEAPTEQADDTVTASGEQAETNTDTTYDDTTTDDSDAGTQATCTTGTTESGSTEDVEADVPFVSLDTIRSYDLGTELVTEGVVAVLPGVLAKQLFYIVGPGIQTYLYSAEFPAMERGSKVRVRGELSEAGGELRLKAGSTEDIQLIGTMDAPTPTDIDVVNVDEVNEGSLVRVTGTVTDKNSGSFLIADATGEARVVIKPTTGIAMPADVGDELTVTAIVSQTTSGYRLLPRDQQDLVLRSEDTEGETAAAGGILSSGSGNGTAGWVLSGIALAAFLASAGVYGAKKLKESQLVTA